MTSLVIVAGLAAASGVLGISRSTTRLLLPATFVLAALALFVIWRRISTVWRNAVKADLLRDLADEAAYDVVAAVERSEFGDEGAHWYLRLRDGRVLFLSGQYLDPYMEPADHGFATTFPCTRVRRVVAPQSHIVLSFECSGTPLIPEPRLPAFTRARIRRGDIPSDGDILTASYAEVLTSEA